MRERGRERVLSRRDSKCKGPEVGTCTAFWKNMEEADVFRAETASRTRRGNFMIRRRHRE